MKAKQILATLLPFLALALQWLLWSWIAPFVWFLFFPTVFFSARLGGLRAGLSSAVLSCVLVWFFFIPPQLSWKLENPANLYSVGLFLVMGYLFSDAHERLRRAQADTDAALNEARAANAKISELYRKTLELDELKSQFFANVSHELRTPLTLIMSPLSRRLAAAEPTDARRQEDRMMLRNARLLYRHVSDLLDAAKLESGRMSVDYAHLDLGKLTLAMTAQFDSLAREKEIGYRIDAPPSLEVEADGEMLQRILLNLLSNAFKFTPTGGHIALRLREEGEQALIEVEDDGPGVPADLREAVFERFHQLEGGAQRRFGGTGLGLAIVREFAELHGGGVSVAEASSGGALFSVRLPLHAPAGTPVRSMPARLDPLIDAQTLDELRTSPQHALPGIRGEGGAPLVLVVEDNADMNAFIAEVLTPHYRVACAYDGRQGLEMAFSLRPDLILCDVMMPHLSGDRLVSELRRQPEMTFVPIIMLTAKAEDALRLRMFNAGVQDYLSKPFAVEELLARVGGLLAARRNTLEELTRSAQRLRRLAEIVEKIAGVRDLPRLATIVSGAARELTGAHGATVVLREQGYCRYVDEDAIGPLWKGQCFPLESCLSGWVMLHAEAAVIEDIDADPRIPRAIYGQTFVKSLAMVPAGREAPLGAIGCYWASRHSFGDEELELQQALADALAIGLSNLNLYQRLASARQAAEDSATALKEAQRLAGTGNWTWDLRSERIAWSEVMYRIFGLDPALPPATYAEMQHHFTPESWARLAAAVEKVRAVGGRYACDAEVVRPDGTHRWIVATGEAQHDGDGIVVSLQGTIQDITERKLAEEEIRRLNADLERRVAERTAELTAANRELDAFAYAVSHDLRAPLRAMSGFSRALIEDCGNQLQGEARFYLEQIDQAGRRMGKLIDALLTLSRSTRVELRRDAVDLSALARRVLAELAQNFPERRVATQVETGLRTHGDARMLEVVMRNLLDNAWKYSGQTAAPGIRVFAEQENGIRRFCVADNGAGFDMAHAARLFQPFQRLHRQEEFPGIGVGLATVQRIIHRHGGSIEARGEPGKGAVFCFSLPDTPENPAPGGTETG